MTDEAALEGLAARAVDGDRDALEAVCRELQRYVYRLALRFFSHPQDAEDASQEIMISVLTNLGRFEGRSKLTTWVYTIATRHLLRARTGRLEQLVQGPEPFAEFLDRNLADDYRDETASEVEYRLLCGEVRIACTYGMLLCLSRELRITYLLGDLFGFTDAEGAEALGVAPAAFRQRLSRARRVMRGIIERRCGLVDQANPCRCGRQVRPSIEHGILDPHMLVFAVHPGVSGPIETGTLQRAASQLDVIEAMAEIYRSDPPFEAPTAVWEGIRQAAPDLLG
jgi:RNA polymerase sigma factor (sigma-70 family)